MGVESVSTPDVARVILPDRIEYLNRAVKEQGDVIAFRSGCLLVHPDAVRDLLVTHGSKFIKPRALRWARWTLGSGLLTSDGALHRRQRPIIQPMLHPKRLGGYARVIAMHAESAAKSWSDGHVIDAHHEMTLLTLHIVADALFSETLGPEVDAISSAMNYNVRAFQRMTTPMGRVLAFMPTPFTIRYLLSRRKVLSVMRRFIANRRASGEQKDDLLGRLLSAKAPDGSPAMSENQLIDECMTIFAAGHETTANALTFSLWLVAHHPAVQTKLQQEVDEVLRDAGALPGIDHVDRLPYARMVLSESMRLYPPAWMQGREATEDVTLGSHPIRRGATVFVSQWLVHRDARWWADPDQFIPERFDESAAGISPDGSPRPRWAYFPFGGGSRSCVGEAFAWAEAILALVVLVKGWKFEPVVDAEPIRLEPGITLRPGNAVKLIVRSRL